MLHSENECEVIKVVTLDRTKQKRNVSNTSFEFQKDDSNRDESDYDGSLEILSSSNCSSKKKDCLCRSNKTRVPLCSQTRNCRTNRKRVLIESGPLEDGPLSWESVKKGKQQMNKKGRRNKYKILKSEIKQLKSLVNNLIVHLKRPMLVECGEQTGDTIQDDTVFILGKVRKSRKGNASFSQTRSKKTNSNSRIALIEKLKAAALLEVNMSPESTMAHRKKQKCARTH